MTPVPSVPTVELEHELLGRGAVRVAGMDEVGRGALAGPVTVGPVPPSLRDSKLLRPEVREALVPLLEDWAVFVGTGTASPTEIDAMGIVGALRLAGERALATVPGDLRPDVVLLDGKHNWLNPPVPALVPEPTPLGLAVPAWEGPVRTVVKGDMTCASIAAASVVAKVERDATMCELHEAHPAYAWASNKGYGSMVHRQAILEHGPCVEHRKSWNLGVKR